MVVCTFVLNASDSFCGEAFFSTHLTTLFLCLTHKSTVFSKVEEEVTARDLQGGHTLPVWETLMCFHIEGDLWKLLPSERINQTLILLCHNESPRSEALIRLYNTTDKWSTGPLRHAQVRLRPAEKQLWSFLSNFFIPNVQDAFCLPEHPKSLSCMFTVYLYMFL